MCNNPDRTESVFELSKCGAPFMQYELCDLERLNPDSFRALILLNARKLTPSQQGAVSEWMSRGRSVILVNSSYTINDRPYYEQTLPDGSVRVLDECQLYSFRSMPGASVIREALLTAGVHIYNFQGDVVYAGGGIVSITAVTPGEKRIYLPFRGFLTDVFTGETPEPCEHFTDFTMSAGETRVFRISADS